jgi:hypothetical protein
MAIVIPGVMVAGCRGDMSLAETAAEPKVGTTIEGASGAGTLVLLDHDLLDRRGVRVRRGVGGGHRRGEGGDHRWGVT